MKKKIKNTRQLVATDFSLADSKGKPVQNCAKDRVFGPIFPSRDRRNRVVVTVLRITAVDRTSFKKSKQQCVKIEGKAQI